MPISISAIVRKIKSFRDTQPQRCPPPLSGSLPETQCGENRPPNQNLFLTLPAELRLVIYMFTFEPYLSAESRDAIEHRAGRDPSTPRPWAGPSEAIRPCIRLDTALLRTCKLIYHEAAQIVSTNANLVHRFEALILPKDKTRATEEMAWHVIPVFHPDSGLPQWIYSIHEDVSRAPGVDTHSIQPAGSVGPLLGMPESGSAEKVIETRDLKYRDPETSMKQCETIRMDLVCFSLGGCLSFSGGTTSSQPSPLFGLYAGTVRRLVLEVCHARYAESAKQQVHGTEEFLDAFLPCASPMRVCDIMDKVEEIVLEVWRRVDPKTELKDMLELGWSILKNDSSEFRRVSELDEMEFICVKSRKAGLGSKEAATRFRVDRVVWQLA